VIVQSDSITRRGFGELEDQVSLNTFFLVVATSAWKSNDVGDGGMHPHRRYVEEKLELGIRELWGNQEASAQRRLSEEGEEEETHAVGVSGRKLLLEAVV